MTEASPLSPGRSVVHNDPMSSCLEGLNLETPITVQSSSFILINGEHSDEGLDYLRACFFSTANKFISPNSRFELLTLNPMRYAGDNIHGKPRGFGAKGCTVSRIMLCEDSRGRAQFGCVPSGGLCPEEEVNPLVWTGHWVIWPHDLYL